MKAELATVLVDSVLARSPVLARLLCYLVETTINGQGRTLKSYSVAVDGLGRSPDFDSQADSYARVQVARLRKLLDSYYADAGAKQGQRLLIDSGSYEVRLVPHVLPSQPQPDASRARFALPGGAFARRLMVAGIVASLVVAVVLVRHWQAESKAATERWRASDFPFVDVTVNDETEEKSLTDLAHRMRQSILMNLDNYEGIRVAYAPGKVGNYSINVILHKSGDLYFENVIVIDRKTNRLISSDQDKVTFDDTDNELSSDKFISKSVFYIVHPTGVIHSSERKRNYRVDTPYGCWLRFTAQLQNSYSVGDRALAQCAQDWHSAAPNHPLGAALYGWTLIDESISQVSETGRRQTIQDAVSALESAEALNPNSPFLQIALVRAYSFAGDNASMHVAAARALKLNPDSLDIQGLSGMMLTLWNDPQGEVLLNKAIAEHFNPPPWYFIGTYVSAMMRQDTAGAGRSLDQLKGLHHSQAIRPILAAAFEAHSGQMDQARVSWDQAVTMQPILKIKPNMLFERLPVAPEVRMRLQQWLAPVLASRPLEK
jgi:hypothetical protein